MDRNSLLHAQSGLARLLLPGELSLQKPHKDVPKGLQVISPGSNNPFVGGDAAREGGECIGLILFVGDMDIGFCVLEPSRVSTVDDVDDVGFVWVPAHDKVLRLDAPVDIVLGVDILDASNLEAGQSSDVQ